MTNHKLFSQMTPPPRLLGLDAADDSAKAAAAAQRLEERAGEARGAKVLLPGVTAQREPSWSQSGPSVHILTSYNVDSLLIHIRGSGPDLD